MPKRNFEVAIMHGHSTDYLKVKNYILELGYSPRILIEEYIADTIFENFRNLIWDDIHCVIVMLTKDDLMANGKLRARQNVIFELGYSFGAFDSILDSASYGASDAMIILSEKDVELFADIDGLTRIEYETGSIESKKELILSSLEKTYQKAKKFYLTDFLF